MTPSGTSLGAFQPATGLPAWVPSSLPQECLPVAKLRHCCVTAGAGVGYREDCVVAQSVDSLVQIIMMVGDTAGRTRGQVWTLVQTAKGFLKKLYGETKLQKASCSRCNYACHDNVVSREGEPYLYD